MKIYLDTAMSEMNETQRDLSKLVLFSEFYEELTRIRLDLNVSPFVNLTDEMCKWVILAYQRSITYD